MDTNAEIIVTSEKDGEKGESFSAAGSVLEKGGARCILYTEPGIEGVLTTLKINDNAVTLIRFGKQRLRLEFKKGVKTGARYGTPYGDFEMKVITEKVHIREKESGGEVYLAYILDFSGERSFNKFRLSYSFQEGQKQ